MTQFTQIPAERRSFRCECGAELRFTLGGYSPAVRGTFTPPADNPHAHNDPDRAGYDPRCVKAAPLPERFTVVCGCGRAYWKLPADGDLCASPQEIIDALAAEINSWALDLVRDPAVLARLGKAVQQGARLKLNHSGIWSAIAALPCDGDKEEVIRGAVELHFVNPLFAFCARLAPVREK